MAKVSVIVPVYNVERYIEKCLDSLVNQTLDDLEIIVVNDGSPDNSEEIVLKFKEKYDNVKYIKKENGGVAVARNVGIKAATGEYVSFVDSDDYLDLDMFEKLYDKAKSTNAEVVMSAYYDEDDDGKYKVRGNGNMHEYGVSLLENPKMVFVNNAFVFSKIYSKELIERKGIEFKKYRIFEDLLFLYTCLMHANKVEKVDQPFYHYIRRENVSVTGKMNKKFYDLFPVMQELRDEFKKNGWEFQEYLTYMAIKHAYLRFNMNVDKETKELKKQYILDSYAFLDTYDPNWKKNVYFKLTKRRGFWNYSVGYWMVRPKIIRIVKKFLR